MKDSRQELGARIRNARKAKGLTQAQLAEKIGIKRATLSKYETGAIEPSITHLSVIASWLGVGFYDLLGKGRSIAYDTGFSDGVEIEEYLDKQIEELRKQSGYSWSELEEELISYFSKLNEEGQLEAVKRIGELTLIPKYQKPPEPEPEAEPPPVNDGLPF